jgi:2-oxoacid:acceptor oxidoreductase delta subunit (pyruvate/2-ketoisovalerate family)
VGESLDPAALPAGLGNGAGVETDAFGASTNPRFFAGGDVLDGPRTVAHALGAGKRAALGIDRLLREERGETEAETAADPEALRYGRLGNLSATRWRNDDPVHRAGPVNETVPYEKLNTEHFEHRPLHGDRLAFPGSRWSTFDEVNRGLGPETALEEARRCFNCGVCNRCEICLIYCPDVAISRREDGLGFEIDYDHCKGCGLCNAECPRGAMEMTREGL